MLNYEKMNIYEIIELANNHPINKFVQKDNKKLVMYGAGEVCEKILEQILPEYHIPIEGIVDRDKTKEGIQIGKYGVMHLDNIKAEIDNFKFIIAIKDCFSAVQTLKEYGVKNKDVYYPKERICYINGTSNGFNSIHSYLSPIDIKVNHLHYENVYNSLNDDLSKKNSHNANGLSLNREHYT